VENDSALVNKMSYSEYSGGKESILDGDTWASKHFSHVRDGYYTDGFVEGVLYTKDGKTVWTNDARADSNRSHPDLIGVIEKLGDEASSRFSKLTVIEIPDDVEWEISEYDGAETVEEVHRSWS
jgi:hypothetical protein